MVYLPFLINVLTMFSCMQFSSVRFQLFCGFFLDFLGEVVSPAHHLRPSVMHLKLIFYEYHVFWPRLEEQNARDHLHLLAKCIAFENNVLLKLGEMFGQLSGKTRSCIQYFREKTCIRGVRNTQFCQNTQAFGLFICL